MSQIVFVLLSLTLFFSFSVYAANLAVTDATYHGSSLTMTYWMESPSDGFIVCAMSDLDNYATCEYKVKVVRLSNYNDYIAPGCAKIFTGTGRYISYSDMLYQLGLNSPQTETCPAPAGLTAGMDVRVCVVEKLVSGPPYQPDPRYTAKFCTLGEVIPPPPACEINGALEYAYGALTPQANAVPLNRSLNITCDEATSVSFALSSDSLTVFDAGNNESGVFTLDYNGSSVGQSQPLVLDIPAGNSSIDLRGTLTRSGQRWPTGDLHASGVLTATWN